MFHAWVYLLSCVLSTLWSTFHMISWTNLLTRATVPAACFLLILLQESQKMNILGIGRVKSQSAYFSGRHLKPEYETEKSWGPATPPGPRQGVVWPPCGPSPALLLAPWIFRENINFGFCPVQFWEYWFFDFLEPKIAENRQLALWLLLIG